jgi:hypothetical protein
MRNQGMTTMHDNKEHQCPTTRSKRTTMHNNEEQHHTTTKNHRMITMHINDKEK